MDRFVGNLFSSLTEMGFQARIVSTSHLDQLQQEIEGLLKNVLVDEQFYKERLTRFSFQIPKDLQEAKSLIIVAVPRPQTRAVFSWNGKRCPLICPPTYTGYDSTTQEVEKVLAKILGKKGYKSTGAALPLKLLAARSGLVQYGRNNVSYASGLGSFFQLVAVYSDLPIEEDSWQEVTMMNRCKDCDLCRKACPTGAIASDRFFLHAECCITYHNEKEGEIPFPDWMESYWHNCIVGCMRCQKVCPVNRDVIQWIEEEVEFSEEETALILEGTPQDKLPKITLKKLQRLSLDDYYNRLPRNMGIFFKKR